MAISNKFKWINWTNLDCFERRLRQFFKAYGGFVSHRPLPFILFPILLAGALSIGFMLKDEVTDAAYLYTPHDARSKYERDCIDQKWPTIDGSYIPGRGVTELRQAVSIVTTKDGGSILRPQHADAINRLNLFVLYQIKVNYQGKTFNYMDLCLHWKDVCYTNPQVGLVSTLFNYPNPKFANLTYPTARIGETSIYLASSLGGVEVNETSRWIEFARAWLLVYQLRFERENVSYVSGLWELEFQRRLQSYFDPLIKVSWFHSQTLSLELKKNGDELAPMFAVSFGILVAFATAVSYSLISGTNFPYIDWVVSKPLLAFWGAVSGGMGIASAIGFLSFCGYMYNQIVGVMPFLVLAVSLDSTFLLISAYRHTDRKLDSTERVSQSMAEAASAVTITMSADFFSFLTGLTVDIPAVQVFSVYIAVAIALTFVYLMTFWLGLFVLAARSEERSQNAVWTCVKTVSPKEAHRHSIFVRLFNQGTRSKSPNRTSPQSPTSTSDLDFVAKWFRDYYAPFLMWPPVRIVVLLLFCAYLAVFGWLATQVNQGLDPVKLLVKGSYVVPYYESMEDYFWRNGSEMQLVINNAPNLADLEERKRVNDLVTMFANTNHTMGMDSVQFWFFKFEDYVRDLGLVSYDRGTMGLDDFYQVVKRFLSMTSNEQFRQDVDWDYVKLPRLGTRWMVKSFRLIIGLQSFHTATLKIQAVNMMRRLAEDPRFVDMNITTFNQAWPFVDQYLGIMPNIIHEVYVGMCFIVVIALLLIPHPLISIWVALTILSVDVGVIGFMTLWDISLDTISMITIMMSIGFSVDYAAYIAHAFVLGSDPRASSEEKVKVAMGQIAWPILQGAASTILAVVVLADLDSYMVVAFFKTVFLVITLALIHGLVFLPVLLSVFVCNGCEKAKKRDQLDGVVVITNGQNDQTSAQLAITSYQTPSTVSKIGGYFGNSGLNKRQGVFTMAYGTDCPPNPNQRHADNI